MLAVSHWRHSVFRLSTRERQYIHASLIIYKKFVNTVSDKLLVGILQLWCSWGNMNRI